MARLAEWLYPEMGSILTEEYTRRSSVFASLAGNLAPPISNEGDDSATLGMTNTRAGWTGDGLSAKK